MVELINGQAILKFMIEEKKVPGEALRRKTQEFADQIEAREGRKPGRKELRELREEARKSMLPNIVPRTGSNWVWVDKAAGLLMIDSTSSSRTDLIVTLLVHTFNSLQISRLNTQRSPQASMTQWLMATHDDWPQHFALGRNVELKSGDETRSVVKYTRHHIDTDEMSRHIKQGKLPVTLGMEWDGRLNFVLTEGLGLKKIEFLDGVFAQEDEQEARDAGFDADVSISTGELRQMIRCLTAALGGEMPDKDCTGTASPPLDAETDPLLEEARELVIKNQKGSISYVQRHLSIGYNRAARLLEELERQRVLSPMDNSGCRHVLQAA